MLTEMRLVAATVVVLWGAVALAEPAVDIAVARQLLPHGEDCSDVECMIERGYVGDPEARQLALTLWRDTGDVAGVGAEEWMDGGYRGRIHLVPQLPVRGHRKHLAWVAEAMRSIDALFGELFARQRAPRYRWQGLAFRFVRSVGKRTPSAYATGWTITYNVSGSLLTSAAGVRETLVHELFHANDGAHGDWSARALSADYDAILARCGMTATTRRPPTDCLTPYAPNTTRVRGGTYYAFQQNNGDPVHEYAAELAVRYLREQEEMLRAGRLAKPAFKCGPAENARAWQALLDEFFAGRDLVPAC
jgi:hypothetical protein